MPELPEVEIYGRYFARHALRQKITAVRVPDERILGDTRKDRLTRALAGRSFKEVRRHGKHLFANAGSAWLHLHFGMTGDLAWYRGQDEPRFSRLVIDFANGSHLAFQDMRLFGVVDLTPDPDLFIAEHRLGPDPLAASFRLPVFRKLVEGRRGACKALLMSQDIIAGMGNLYADETLFQTAVHPRRSAGDLTGAEVRAIFTTMRRILRDVIRRHERGLEMPRRSLLIHREEGARCPRCGGLIVRTVVFGRATYFCAQHQR